MDRMQVKGAVMLQFQSSAWRISRKANKGLIRPVSSVVGVRTDKDEKEVTTRGAVDMDLLTINRKIIDSPEYQAVMRYMGDTRDWLTRRSVPSFFTSGCYLFNILMVPDVEAFLKERQDGLKAVVDKFLVVYPEQIESIRARLAEQFNERDYPSEVYMARLFRMRWAWIAFDVPEGLPKEIFEVEKAKAETRWAEAEQEITLALRVAFNGLITHAVEILTPAPDGKRKRIYPSLVADVTEFVDTFRMRNLTNDTELEALVVKAREILTGVNVDGLRENAGLRVAVEEGFKEIREMLSGLVEDEPIRMFKFADEDEEAVAV